ncbi:hypothetical protein FACHB389_36785 [Nostoc calcicola FACHB-389]|nr:class I SAM-dependent methyltransferase [Nostoc calcicola FACHB-3891]OKH11262.1 hypothetical protein FACHB389_36785 [Nostoc calcicola FACHB-389]
MKFSPQDFLKKVINFSSKNIQISDTAEQHNDDEYEKRIKQELLTYDNVEEIHDLPQCFHYITNKYLCKIIEEITGFSNYRDFFVDEIRKYSLQTKDVLYIASIGSGNSNEELELCQRLQLNNKVIFDCYELNPTLLAQGKEKAKSLGIEMRFFEQDFNQIHFEMTYDGFFASHSLHHVVNLEGLFQSIHQAGKPGYFFLINDMIGRNGHMSWSKTQSFLESYWNTLPERLKWNAFFKKYDLELPNFDCSKEGFEGIRAQDILPLLNENFQFEVFIPFFSFIGRIIDRVYGHNYNIDPNSLNNDLAILDYMWYLDELFLRLKYLPPTQMFAKLVDPRISPPEFKSIIYKDPQEAIEIR